MDWGTDELGHRAAERSGWADELREADPDAVDETVAGAVEFAAATGAAGDATGDTGDPTEAADDTASAPTLTCGFCRRDVPEAEAIDAEGFPVSSFEWVADPDLGETAAYHRECVEAGEGRFLPWGAGGLLGDD